MTANHGLYEKRGDKKEGETTNDTQDEHGLAELVALLRLLTREPPPGHDFTTCPVCRRYGITKI